MSRYSAREYEVATPDGLVRALVTVEGRWYAQTRETPAECPDAWVSQAWQRQDDGHEDGTMPERAVDPDTMPEEVIDALINLALTRDQERLEAEEDASYDASYVPRRP